MNDYQRKTLKGIIGPIDDAEWQCPYWKIRAYVYGMINLHKALELLFADDADPQEIEYRFGESTAISLALEEVQGNRLIDALDDMIKSDQGNVEECIRLLKKFQGKEELPNG